MRSWSNSTALIDEMINIVVFGLTYILADSLQSVLSDFESESNEIVDTNNVEVQNIVQKCLR